MSRFIFLRGGEGERASCLDSRTAAAEPASRGFTQRAYDSQTKRIGKRGNSGNPVVADAVAVMEEAAAWLESRGIPLWTAEELRRLPLSHPADSFLVLYDGRQAAAAALLTESDPLLWPDIPSGTSAFLHKLSVHRAYAGKGLALRLIEYAAEICINKGFAYLRLDCDASREKLCALYQSAGFAFVGERRVRTQTHGTVTAALFERALQREAGTCGMVRFLV